VYEIPVSTMPGLRLPVHWTYINFLAEISPGLALSWIDLHIALCRGRRLAPVLLLHATDVIGADDPCCPAFMPGMRLTSADKAALLRKGLARYCRHFALGSIANLIEGIPKHRALPLRAPERSRLS
jgi:peptidoglycan-N-acetylglucosamine deacetylase